MKVAGGLLVILLVAFASRGEEEQKKAADDREAKFLKNYVGYYSHTTLLSILTRTKTAIFTCISATTTMAACTGRRRRSLIKDIDIDSENLDQVDSSLDGAEELSVDKIPVEVTNREGKKMIVWTSVYSTLEVHTMEYNTGTTLTASAICNVVNGMTIGNSCFG